MNRMRNDKTQFVQKVERIEGDLLNYFSQENITRREESLNQMLLGQSTITELKEYLKKLNLDMMELIIKDVLSPNIKFIIKKSIIMEWFGLILSFTMRKNIEQTKLIKLIQVNHFLWTQKIIEMVQKQNNFEQKKMLTLMEKKIQRFNEQNVEVVTDHSQILNNIYYLAEYIIQKQQDSLNQLINLSQIQPKELKQSMRQYLKLRMEILSIKQYFDIIHKMIIPLLTDQNRTQFLLPASKMEYTLVLDLDETLVHYNEKKQINKRPHLDRFLEELSQSYELVVFTAGLEEYGNWVLNKIDPKGYISHRLFRQHAQFEEESQLHLKDLDRLGRDLSKTIIIDNIAGNFKKHSQNGIQIKSWIDDQNDQQLLQLISVLKEIQQKKGDVRVQLQKIKRKIKQNEKLSQLI